MARHSRLVVPTYPAQRVARTVVADLLVWGPAVLAAIPAVVDASHLLLAGGVIPPSVYAQIVAIGAAATVVKGAVTFLMAQPAVDRLLSLVNLGAVPRSTSRSLDTLTVRGTASALHEIERAASPEQ